MEILLPIGIGFVINFIVFTFCKMLQQSTDRYLVICFITFIAVLVASLIIGSWVGMGIGVISLGMFIFVILAWVVFTFVPGRRNSESS